MVVVDKDVKAANKISDEITSQGLGAAASSIEVSFGCAEGLIRSRCTNLESAY